jgi:hypothetical protein
MGAASRAAVITALLAVYILFGCPLWLLNNDWYIAVAHHFFHANIFHLAANSFSFWILFRRKTSITEVAIAFLIATLSCFASPAHPVGISNFLFAYIGMLTPAITHSWWRSRKTITFLAINAAFVFVPQVSAVTHIVSFALGSLWAGVQRKINRLSHDIG